MRITAYTYVRNGLKMGYPFLESIRSILSLVDEYVVVLGDSDDGSREAISTLGSDKIKIVDTQWDMTLKKKGKLFALQSNIGLDQMKGDWVIHLQADEVIHEQDLNKLKKAIVKYNDDSKVEGLLFPFLNFRGDYQHIHTGRKAHRFEIRAFKRAPMIRSFKDSQGFRKYTSFTAYEMGEKGKKLRVARIDVPIYHYNYVRPPGLMKEKAKVFLSQYKDDAALEQIFGNMDEFDYNDVDKLDVFTGTHPAVMQEAIRKQDWVFVYDPSRHNTSLRHRVLNKIEEWTGYRIGEYKNYKRVR
jgi:glycosyltransferase involved in cell wall biosynthesis